MPITDHALSLGMPPSLAGTICGVPSAALTATGSTQATSLLMGRFVNYFGTVAASTGAQLPAVSGGSVLVYNAGANALSVYGQNGEAIGTGAANAAFSVPAGKGCEFYKVSSTLWAPNLSA